MNQPVKDPEVIIAALKAASPSAAGDAIVLQAQALVAGELQHLDIAIQTDLAPAVAIALLNSTASARSRRQALDPALLCIAAGVAPASTTDNVRIQLLFEAGAVLPVELPRHGAAALLRGLLDEVERQPLPAG
jgi:hypothetical protein